MITGFIITLVLISTTYKSTLGIETEPEKPPDDLGAWTSASHPNFRSSMSYECRETDPDLVTCNYNKTCIYGELNTVSCQVDEELQCKGSRVFDISFPCLYCWQLPEDSYSCLRNSTCKINRKYLTTCKVNYTSYCLGHREFTRYTTCQPTTGYRWSTTLVLSILFGGFGVDRFYLGHWQEGVGKLFSFGGFGVWTLIDTILISIGYLKPSGSHYE